MHRPVLGAQHALRLLPLLLLAAPAVADTPAKFTQDAITLQQDPAAPTDAARKAYVDAQVAAVQALAASALPGASLGQPSGPARLGPGGTLPLAQLPVGTAAGTVAAGNDPRIPAVGNQAPGSGSMVVDLLHEAGTPRIQGEAGIWSSANVRSYMAVGRSWGAGEGAANGPVASLFAMATNTGTAADVVAVLGDAVLRQAGGTVFGGNLIARTAAGVNGKLVGLEIDVEPAAGTLATAGSGGLFVNAYSSAVAGPAILLGGLGGGTFANGMQCAAIAATGSCLAPQVGAVMRTMMDSSQATYNDAALRIGNGGGTGANGPGQRIALTGSDGLDSVITTDGNKYLKLSMGTNGLVITNQPQSANLLLLTASNGNLTLPIATAQLVGTGDLNLSATTGQVNVTRGVRLPSRTVASGASDTAGPADYVIKWNKPAGSVSAQAIPACVAAVQGRVLVVKDGKGDAASNPITVTPAAGTIDAAASYAVNTARGAVTLHCDGSGDWSVLGRM